MVTEDGTEENMIDKIVDARRRGRGKQYLVRWVGYDRDHDEWLSGRIPKLWTYEKQKTVRRFDNIQVFQIGRAHV